MPNKIIDIYPTDTFGAGSALWQTRNTYQRHLTWKGPGKWIKKDSTPFDPIPRTKALDAIQAMGYTFNCVDPKPEPPPPLHITHAVMVKVHNSPDQVVILGTEESCRDYYLKNSLAGFKAVCYIRPVTFATCQCECDNTHKANNTVCRFCWERQHPSRNT